MRRQLVKDRYADHFPESRAAGNPITPGRLDEPRYISGNGPNHTNSRYVMTPRYLFVTVHTTQQFAEGLLGR